MSSPGFLFCLGLRAETASNLEMSTDVDNKSPNKTLVSLDQGPALHGGELLDRNLSPLADAVEDTVAPTPTQD